MAMPKVRVRNLFMTNILIQRARELRKNSTIAERKLWRYLRSRDFSNFKFRRQSPIGKFIVDFVCFEKKLVIELDGGQHNEQKEVDIKRDNWLRKEGFTILRFWNNEVINNINGVLQVIKQTIDKLPSQ